jgi:hypothetical protein
VFVYGLQLCNFIDWRNLKLVYKRYASLYFVTAIDNDDNELVALDMIHQFVEVLDKHFSNVCELDLVFHFYKAYWLMDEVFLAGVRTAFYAPCYVAQECVLFAFALHSVQLCECFSLVLAFTHACMHEAVPCKLQRYTVQRFHMKPV